ncbi:hypothetical protein J3169_004399 [Salmonella enterica]|nr:hypothetical protein [Salmonella enterica]
MSDSHINTREFIQLTGWCERDFFKLRYEYSEAFPRPITRTADGNQYAPADVLPFVARIIAERRAKALALVDALNTRTADIAERAAALGVTL